VPIGIDALLIYAKIPGDTIRQLACLEAVFQKIYPNFSWKIEDLSTMDANPISIDALLTCAKIPGNAARQLACLEAVFQKICPNFSWKIKDLTTIAMNNPMGFDILLTYAKIPGNTARQLACLEIIFLHKKNNEKRTSQAFKIYENIKNHCPNVLSIKKFLRQLEEKAPSSPERTKRTIYARRDQ
jgi:hypothetical protein